MVDTVFPSQVVLFTQHYSISGGIFLHDQRLSDFLNDRRDTTIMVRNGSVALLNDPAKILEKTTNSIVPKAGIVVAFEPVKKTSPLGPKFIKYPKQKYDVFLALDGMEVHGKLNQPGPLDMRNAITNSAVPFIPITSATLTLDNNPGLVIKREAVLVNVQHIRFVGNLEAQTPPEETP